MLYLLQHWQTGFMILHDMISLWKLIQSAFLLFPAKKENPLLSIALQCHHPAMQNIALSFTVSNSICHTKKIKK